MTIQSDLCDHTVHALDDAGKLTGSWIINKRKEGLPKRHISCKMCGKFYANIADDQALGQQKIKAKKATAKKPAKKSKPKKPKKRSR